MSTLHTLMEHHPDLGAHGFFPAAKVGEARFTAQRAALSKAEDQVARVMAWLADAPRTRRPQVGSYLLKHIYEETHLLPGCTCSYEYLPNGVLIAAALLSGIAVKVEAPNALLAIEQRWVRKVGGGIVRRPNRVTGGAP